MTTGKSPKRARRANRGALVVITALLTGSGLIRLGDGAGQAFALASEPEKQITEPVSCEPDAGAMALLDGLKSRETRLASREAMIADRAQALALAEAKIDEKLAALVAAEQQLASTLAIADKAAETDIARLTAVYENMKPKEAAPLFTEMDPEFAAGFLARMRPDAAAAVMSGLDPKTAYTISVLLAGRNANAPKE